MVIFHEDDISGTVRWLPVNGGLLSMHLTTTTLTVSLLTFTLVTLPIKQICTVQIVSPIIRPEIVITYMDARNAFKVMSLHTRHAQQWVDAFCQAGIPFIQPIL